MNLDVSTIRTTALWVLVIVSVVGVALAILVKKIVGKIITLVVAALIVLFGWQQRDRVVDYANEQHSDLCESHPKFFGVDVTYPTCS